MLTSRIISCILILAAVTYVTAVPIQMGDDTLRMNGGVYEQPNEFPNHFAGPYTALSGTVDNVRLSHFPRQSRLGLDSLSGSTFGESKRFGTPRESEWPNNINGLEIYEGSIKRNIDEIDRTGFDNFLKRNFDEIDRSGWDSFVKRRMIGSYLNNKQN